MDLIKYKKQRYVKKKEPIYIKTIDLPNNCTGWLVIDSMGFGSACGGIRIGKNVSLEEVKLLANEMTLKYSFYNLSNGGAKAGIRCPFKVTVKEREEIFYNFGKALNTLLCNRIYIPGTDLGTTRNDINQLRKGAGLEKIKETAFLDSSFYTSVSIISALRAITAYTEMSLNGTRIGIQGLGKVGTNVLRLASEFGQNLVAVSTQSGALYEPSGLDIDQILNLVHKYDDDFVFYYPGAKQIRLEEFFEKDMDIMIPCAGIYPIHERNVQKIKAKIIVSGCNVAAVSEVEKVLHKRKIAYLPGFVSNAGGVLGSVLKDVGLEDGEIYEFINCGVESRVSEIMANAERNGGAYADIAHSMVIKNQEKFMLDLELPSNKKQNLLTKRMPITRAAKILRKVVFYMFRHSIVFPNFVRNKYKEMVFERLFKS